MSGDDPFTSFNQQILDIFDALGSTESDEEAAPLMDRWAEIDALAMSTTPSTLADALGALTYASREHHQFKCESRNPDKGERLVQHLVDGALDVLRNKVAAERAVEPLATQEQWAATPFEAWERHPDWEPRNFGHHDAEIGFPIRCAYALNLMPKARLIENFRKTINDENDALKIVYDTIQEGKRFAKMLDEILEAAELRVLIVGASLLEEQEKDTAGAPASDEVAA